MLQCSLLKSNLPRLGTMHDSITIIDAHTHASCAIRSSLCMCWSLKAYIDEGKCDSPMSGTNCDGGMSCVMDIRNTIMASRELEAKLIFSPQSAGSRKVNRAVTGRRLFSYHHNYCFTFQLNCIKFFCYLQSVKRTKSGQY